MAERQMATDLNQVRSDHRLRYEFAIRELIKRGRSGHVVDAGCGVGYGSAMLADVVDEVTSIEISSEAYEVYKRHWQRDNIYFHNRDLMEVSFPESTDAVVCFEFIEHITFYEAAIKNFSESSDLLIISTPNEEVRPHLQEPVNPFHVRHFRPAELTAILQQAGMQVVSWHCQRSGAEPAISAGTNGKFIIAVCETIPACVLQ